MSNRAREAAGGGLIWLNLHKALEDVWGSLVDGLRVVVVVGVFRFLACTQAEKLHQTWDRRSEQRHVLLCMKKLIHPWLSTPLSFKFYLLHCFCLDFFHSRYAALKPLELAPLQIVS